MFSHNFDAIGTRWQIQTTDTLLPRTVERLRARAEEFDRTYSRFRSDSLVRRLVDDPDRYQFPADATVLFDFYRELYDVTDGAVTPLVGLALENLGYDAGYSLRPRPERSRVPPWDDVLTVDGAVITATRPLLLDVGAAGKGYLVDLLAGILEVDGIDRYLVNGSGDLAHRGIAQCRIGLECPSDPTKVIGVANVQNGALCASATNRRTWGPGLHHIVDPATGEPTRGVVATWVVADSAMVADGLATALFFTDPATLARNFSFSFVRMLTSGGVEYSTNFDGELFT